MLYRWKKQRKQEKRIKYMKRENIIIKINIYIQHICLTDFAMRRVHRTYEATFYINTLNLKVNVLFSYSDSVSRP